MVSETTTYKAFNVTTEMATEPPDPIDNTSAYFLYVIPSAAVIGNLLVVLTIRRSVALQRMFYFMSISLVVSEILSSLLIMPVSIMRHVLGDFLLPLPLCPSWLVLDAVLLSSTVTHLCMLVYNTQRSLLHPLNYRLHQTARYVCLQVTAAWGAALLLSVPYTAFILSQSVDIREQVVKYSHCMVEVTGLSYFLAKYVPGFILPALACIAICFWVTRKAQMQEHMLEKIASVVENKGVICNGNVFMPNLMVIETVTDETAAIKKPGSEKAGLHIKGNVKPKPAAVRKEKEKAEKKRNSVVDDVAREPVADVAREPVSNDDRGNQMSIQAEVHSSDESSNDDIDKDLSDFDDAESISNGDGFSDMDSVCRSISTNSSCSGYVIDATDDECEEMKQSSFSMRKKDEEKSEQVTEVREKTQGETGPIADDTNDVTTNNQVGTAEQLQEPNELLMDSMDQTAQKTDCGESDFKINNEVNDGHCIGSHSINKSDTSNSTQADRGQWIPTHDETISESPNPHTPKSGDICCHSEDQPVTAEMVDVDIADEENEQLNLLPPSPIDHQSDSEPAANRHQELLERTDPLSTDDCMDNREASSTSKATILQDRQSECNENEDKQIMSESAQDSDCGNKSNEDEAHNRQEELDCKQQKDADVEDRAQKSDTKPIGKESLNVPLQGNDPDLAIGLEKKKLLGDSAREQETGFDNLGFDHKIEPDGTISLADAIKVRCPSVCNKDDNDKIEPAEENDQQGLKSNNGSLMVSGENGEIVECKIPPGRRSILKRDNSKRNSQRKSVKFASDVGESTSVKRESRKIVRKGTKHVKVTHPDHAKNTGNGHAPTLSNLSLQKKNVVKIPLSPEASSSLEYLTKINSVQGKRASERLKKDQSTIFIVAALLAVQILLTVPYMIAYGINLQSAGLINATVIDVLQFFSYCSSLLIPVILLLSSRDMRSNCTGIVCCLPEEYGNGWGDGEGSQAVESSNDLVTSMPVGDDKLLPNTCIDPTGSIGNGHVIQDCGGEEQVGKLSSDNQV